MPHFDQSTWLAKRAQQIPAGAMDEPEMVALPGVKHAVDLDTLHAHQQLGRQQHEIVRRVNERHAKQNADQLRAHHEWAAGPYQREIAELRERDLQAKAAELRHQATLERLAEGD